MVRFFAAAFLAVALATPAAAQTATANPAPTGSLPSGSSTEAVHVGGFRSAKWGMTEAALKKAISSEFNIPADALKSIPSPVERTTVVAITVPELLEGAGAARISYILGYASKKLIEVNIEWGTPIDPQAKPEMVLAAANQLRDLFLRSGYAAGTITTSGRGSDGSVIVFSGQDAAQHTTVLRLLQTPGSVKEKQPPMTALFLAYVMDSRNPDIFRPKKKR